MKTITKRMISMLGLISVLLTLISATELPTQSTETMSENVAMQEVLQTYFDARLLVFQENEQLSELTAMEQSLQSTLNEMNVSASVRTLELQRADATENLKNYHGVYPIRAENTYQVVSTHQNENHANQYVLDVYEWTWIEYTNGTDDFVNEMGYATEHEMTVQEQSNGEYRILTDVYDESAILGEASINLQTRESQVSVENTAQPTASTNVELADVNALIDYADQYVIHERGSGMLTEYYNTPMYGYFSGADCANFVSQCLRVGGMGMDYGTGKNYANGDATQWWYDTYPSPLADNYTVCPPAWRSVPNFIRYWVNNKGYSQVTATSSNVFPGNPVLSGTTHVGICVGYNSVGIPIVNAHNSDVYHVPYTMIGSNITTIQINTSNHMVWKPGDATVLTPTGTDQTIRKTMTQRSNHYFKIVVSATDDYVFETSYYNNDNIDTKATLYKESNGTGNNTVYLYECASDDNSGTGYNFKLQVNLSPGTYYLRVRATTPFAYGQYTFHYRTE